jgi:DNA-binding transcriptional LysR family regulator
MVASRADRQYNLDDDSMPKRYALVELRRLRYFIAIAEHGGVGRAAAVLHVAQPALSRQLRLLEAEVGATLVLRHAGGVTPTAAGELFLKGARQMLDDSARLVSMARAVATGRSGELAVGVSDVYCWHPIVVSVVRAFRERYPHIELRLMPLLSGDITARVLSGRLDAGLVFSSEPVGPQLLRTPLLRDHLALAVHASRSLPARPALRQFADTDFIVPSRELSPKLYDLVIRELNVAGLVPSRLHQANSHTAALGLVAAGIGCAVVPECAHLRVPDSVVVRRVSGLRVPIPIELIRLPGNESPALARFAEVASSVTGRGGPRLRMTGASA